MKQPIYLDNAATTPLDTRVLQAMLPFLSQQSGFGNPSSPHFYGKAAKEAVEIARSQVAALIHAEPSEIIFTSGATEAINLALKGAAQLKNRKGRHIITMQTEHKAVLDTCQYLEKEGYEVSYLAPQKNGELLLSQLKEAIRADTILVSIMYVNNETGFVQDINGIANETASRQILFHVDAAQAAGKLPIDVINTPIDLLSFTAHKIYGPKGSGALYLRKKPRVRVQPLLHGGGHEQGMRSGTLATHQIVGLGAACDIAQHQLVQDASHITNRRDLFLQKIADIPAIKINSDLSNSIANIVNIRFDGMIADAVLAQLPEIAASTASACQGSGAVGSYVLRAMGLSDAEIKSSVRISFGRFTTEEDILIATDAIGKLFAR